MKTWARMPFFLAIIVAVCFALPRVQGGGATAPPAPGRAPARGSVYLAKDLSPEKLVVLSAALASRDRSSILLLDRPAAAPAKEHFLAELPHSRAAHVRDLPRDVR